MLIAAAWSVMASEVTQKASSPRQRKGGRGPHRPLLAERLGSGYEHGEARVGQPVRQHPRHMCQLGQNSGV